MQPRASHLAMVLLTSGSPTRITVDPWTLPANAGSHLCVVRVFTMEFIIFVMAMIVTVVFIDSATNR